MYDNSKWIEKMKDWNCVTIILERPDVDWLDGWDRPDSGYGWDIQDFKAFWVILNKQTLADNAVSLYHFLSLKVNLLLTFRFVESLKSWKLAFSFKILTETKSGWWWTWKLNLNLLSQVMYSERFSDFNLSVMTRSSGSPNRESVFV